MAIKKITKKQSKEFNEKFIKGILELGAIKIDLQLYNTSTNFELNTVAGRLEIHLPLEQRYCFTVFSCFDEADKAKLKFSCNPYSGKYNYHGTTEPINVDVLVETALMMFVMTLPKEK